jgi:hypothetical protein
MTAASFTPSMSRQMRLAAAAAAAAVALIAASAGTANAARLPAPAAPGGRAASVCSPAQVAAAACLDYTIAAGADPWVAAVTSELAQPGGEVIAAKFVAARGRTHHDAEQTRLEALLHDGGARPDAKRLPAYTYSGVGTAEPGGASWEYRSYALMGICIVNSCPVTDKVNFSYTIATGVHWLLVARYQVAHGTYYVVSKWDCDLRQDEGKTSRHLASWSICGERSGLGSSGVIEETSTIRSGAQGANLFGSFTFLVGPSGGVPAKFTFQSKRWHVVLNGGTFY